MFGTIEYVLTVEKRIAAIHQMDLYIFGHQWRDGLLSDPRGGHSIGCCQDENANGIDHRWILLSFAGRQHDPAKGGHLGSIAGFAGNYRGLSLVRSECLSKLHILQAFRHDAIPISIGRNGPFECHCTLCRCLGSRRGKHRIDSHGSMSYSDRGRTQCLQILGIMGYTPCHCLSRRKRKLELVCLVCRFAIAVDTTGIIRFRQIPCL
mmetsp:Transcript_33940/g.78269  ORF Transcript_33940/g.78269 Transcript_33940/m.78269 type:complete len:207 (+) Transcript_33940:135-755(+)